MSEETPGQALVLAEIAEIRKATPFGTPGYTQEVDKRVQALYQRAYPEPDEEGEAPKGRQFPEVQRPRREVLRPKSADPAVTAELRQLHAKSGKGWLSPQDQRRATALGRDIGHAENERRLNQDRIDTVDAKLYGGPTLEGTHPSFRDWAIWRAAIKTAQRLGIEPEDMVELKEAVLTAAEEFPQDQDDDDESDYSPDDYPPPFSIPDENSWRIFKAAREIAARHNVSPAAFSELSMLVLAGNEVIGEPQMARAQRAAVFDLIHNVGEDRAVSVVKAAQRALEHFRPSGPELDRLLATPVAGALTLGDHPILIELLGNVGAAISFDALPREFRSPNGSYNPRKQRLQT